MYIFNSILNLVSPLEPKTGFEPVTSSLPRKCSTTELHWQNLKDLRAEDEAQTRDPQLGRLMLYQLSYFRLLVKVAIPSGIPSGISAFTKATSASWEKMDSNHRRYKPADLQSAPFGHSGILPYLVKTFSALFCRSPLL